MGVIRHLPLPFINYPLPNRMLLQEKFFNSSTIPNRYCKFP